MNENAPKHGWTIPDIRDLQAEYREAGHSDMTKLKILYFCNSRGGFSILKKGRGQSKKMKKNPRKCEKNVDNST
jgi:uncharacterized protein (DUF302 family)